MELIIRVTGRCNFDCTFCSAGDMEISHPKNGVPEQIKKVIETIKPNGIIISGGEPLMVDPSYYYELHELAGCHIAITTNLKDFYFHPEKWAQLFNEPWIGITTSFNYGETRRWDPNTVFTEEKFIEIYELYKKYTNGKDLPFIAVLDEDNEDTAIQLAELAKRLGTYVRINNATKQGRQQTTYPRYKLFAKYFEIIEAGLGDYEVYCKFHEMNKCPINKDMLCHAMIRTCYVDANDVLHYYDCCDIVDKEHLLDLENDNLEPESKYPHVSEHVNSNCIFCELFPICNGCRSQKIEYPPEHCEEMLKMKDKFKKYGWI